MWTKANRGKLAEERGALFRSVIVDTGHCCGPYKFCQAEQNSWDPDETAMTEMFRSRGEHAKNPSRSGRLSGCMTMLGLIEIPLQNKYPGD
jgi:hypothetical protein